MSAARPPRGPNRGLAIAALVVGVVSLLTSIIALGLILGPVAALLGFASRRRSGGNFAVAAIVLGLIAFVASGAWILYAVLSMGW
jgi:hypothetical protein